MTHVERSADGVKDGSRQEMLLKQQDLVATGLGSGCAVSYCGRPFTCRVVLCIVARAICGSPVTCSQHGSGLPQIALATIHSTRY